MHISRKKFITSFFIFGFTFLFISTSLLGSTGTRGFPKHPDSLLGTASPIAWKQTTATIIMPIKIVLIGPLLFSNNFLQDDPPPPFIGIYLTFYWLIIGLVLYQLLLKLNVLNPQRK